MTSRQAQEFRANIIASEMENLPTGLLELLETAETIASKLVKTQNRLIEDEQKRIVPVKVKTNSKILATAAPQSYSNNSLSQAAISSSHDLSADTQMQDEQTVQQDDTVMQIDTTDTTSARPSQDDNSVAVDPRSVHDRLNYMRQPTQMCTFGTLEPHQFDALKWIVALDENNMNGLLADDMGLGKTVQTIAFMCYLQETRLMRDQPHLVIAPKSTISNWMKELRNWAPELRIVNLNPRKEVRNEILREQMQPGQFDVCVTTYEAIQYVPELRHKKFNWYLVTFDEAHKLKNSESITIQLSRQIKSTRRLLLTGTPLQNDITELWSLLNFMMPQIFNDREEFGKWFNFDSQQNTQSKELSQEAKFLVIQILHRVLKPFMLRRTKADRATKLPDKIEINIGVGLTAIQLKLYQEMLQVKTLMSTSGVVKPFHNMLMQLRKICNHPYLFEGVEEEGSETFGEHLVVNSGKMIFLDKLLKKCRAQKEQIILFSGFTTMLSIIEDFCSMRKVPYCRLDGSTELADREAQIDDFSRPDSDKAIFLISTRAGGLGINLVSANHVVLYDSDFNPQVDLQAMDRAHRIGQRKNVYVYRLVTKDTVEEKIVQRQAIKLKVDSIFIQQGRKVNHSMAMSKDEYEKIILHGAQQIMQSKTDMIDFGININIDSLIEEGIEKNRLVNEQADQQANQVAKASTATTEEGLDLTLQRIDMFKFQDQDFREVRRNFQMMMHQRQQEELQKRAQNQGGTFVRPMRTAAQECLKTLNDEHSTFKLARAIRNNQKSSDDYKPSEGEDFLPQKDKSISLQKVYEFQFYDNFDTIQAQTQKIQQLIDNFSLVPDELKGKYHAMLATGFTNWNLADYKQFFKAFRKHSLQDLESIASEIETKTLEEVAIYAKVFEQRYFELKERDQISLKLQQKDFEAQNLETILKFDHEKAQRGEYVVLLQTNDYFNKSSYLALISKAQQKLNMQNMAYRGSKDLQLKLDHFLHAQAKQIAQEQIKAVATALRAEEALKKHLSFTDERRDMKRGMARAKIFASGCEGIQEKEQQALEEQQQLQRMAMEEGKLSRH